MIRKRISNFVALLVMSVGLVLAGFTACKTTDPLTGERVYDPVRTEQVKAAIQPIIQQGVRRLVTDNPEHTADIERYVTSAANIFCQMRDQRRFDPSVLITEMDKLGAPLLADRFDDDYIITAKDVIIALYKIQYAERHTAELSDTAWLYHVAGLFCDSLTQALRDANK